MGGLVGGGVTTLLFCLYSVVFGSKKETKAYKYLEGKIMII